MIGLSVLILFQLEIKCYFLATLQHQVINFYTPFNLTIYVFLEYMAAMIEMETYLEEIWGVKPRTARGYATIIVCAKVCIKG